MAIQLRSSTKPPSSSSSSSSSSTTQSKSSSASSKPRRSARLSSTTPSPSEPPPEPSHRRKRVRLTAPSEPPPPQPTPRALRLEKRNKEREEQPTPSRKRKATSTDELVVKKKPRSPCRISATNSTTSESVKLDLDLPDIGPSPISPLSPTSESVPVCVTPTLGGTFPNPTELLEQSANTTVNFYPPDNLQQEIPQQWYLPPQPQNYQRRPPRPSRPRQESLHEQMVKAKMCELKRLFSDTRIRQEVDKEAKAYYDAHGLHSWDLSVGSPESPQLLTWKNESEVFPPMDLSTDTQRYSDVEDDTDDDDDDDDDEIDERFGGEVMDLDAPLQCPTVSQGPAVSSEWFNTPQSSLMTSFSLPPAQEDDTQSLMLPPSSFTASYYTSFPQYLQSPPPMISIPVDTPLPRLSSIKVMGLRNLFDIGPRIEDEEEELYPSFTDSSLLSSPGDLSPDQLGARKRRRDGMGNGTPPDPVRRAIWASAGGDNLWALDNTADIGMSLAMNRFVPHTDWNALWATTDMDGMDRQFAAFQQVCAVLSGVATNYST